MSICLVVQKDTLENSKVKSVLKQIDNDPHDFVNQLQENHCIEYQLIAHVSNFSVDTQNRLTNISTPFKTNHGKDWYEFDHEVLSQIVSLFIENEVAILNMKLISSIMGFTFTLFPVVTKEIHVSRIGDNKDEEDVVSMLEQLQSELPKKDRKHKKSSKKE